MDNQIKQNQPTAEPIIAPTSQSANLSPSLFSKYLPFILITLIAGIIGSTSTYFALSSKTKPQPEFQKIFTKISLIPTFAKPKCVTQEDFNFQIDNPNPNDYLYLTINNQIAPGYPKKNVKIMEVKGTSGRYEMFVKNSKGEIVSKSEAISIDCSKIPTPTPTQMPIVLPTLDPSITANWKTYRDNSFSFMYPANWESFPMEKADDLYIDFFEIGKPHTYPDRDSGGNSTMNIRINSRIGDVDLYFKRIHNKSFNFYAQDTQDIIVDERIAAITNKSNAAIWYDSTINKILDIDTSEKYLKTILSTFKFTGQDQVINPSIVLFSPNGDETLMAGETYTIKWKSTGINNVYFSLVNGGKEFDISGPIPASKGQYVWTVPDMSVWVLSGLNSNAFKIFIHNDSATNDIGDYSDATFTIE